ncbi:MAG: uracil-DNA glycosylase family protein, partial [Gammaproteobacteria bacterium]
MQTAFPPAVYDPACRRCARLAAFLDTVRAAHPGYHAAPVAPFGSRDARLLVVGLAPGMHGANASGRPFTGDHDGILLYRTLHRFGFADRPESRHVDDGLRLPECRITNAVKCLPPQNMPQRAEIGNCREYLAAELALLAPGAVVVALGRIAHETLLRAWG